MTGRKQWTAEAILQCVFKNTFFLYFALFFIDSAAAAAAIGCQKIASQGHLTV